MAIISEMEEATAVPFSASFDPSNPLGFLERVLDFIGKESNFLMKDTAEKEIMAAVTAAKERSRKAEKKESVKPTASIEVEKVKKDILEPTKPMEVEKPKSLTLTESKEAETPKEEKQESRSIVPNKVNGLDLEKYSWGQQLPEVTINIPVPVGTKSRSVTCEIKKNSIKVGLKGQDPIIDGEFYNRVKPDDCFWNIEDQKMISVLLTKQDQMEWWKYCVKGEPEIDTQKVEPEPSKLGDLDPESRASIEKMMFDSRQKQMGLPTSDQMQQEEMMKKFMAQNPGMNFSNAPGMNFSNAPGMNFSNAKF